MNDMGDPIHGFTHGVAVRNVSLDDLESRVRLRSAIVAKGANCYILVMLRLQDMTNELGADFARRTGYQDVPHGVRHSAGLSPAGVPLVPGRSRLLLQMQSIHVEQQGGEHHPAQP